MEGSQQTFEFSDGKNKEKKTKFGSISRSSLILLGTNIILSCVILIITILVLSAQKSSHDDRTKSHSTGEDIDESDAAVLERFPGYFRTEEEQRKLERGLRRHIPVNETLDVANCNFSVVNTNDFPWCNLVPSPDEYHSCCVSNIQYVSPVYKTDTNGINRKLAVFDNQRQYFRSETCTQLGGCMMCTCLKEEVLYTGVYDTGKIGQSSRYGVAWFNFDGCCKCYNNVP
ncbi:uncharacterized protein LOC132544824 isoform X1 [Ylistrum balloti]|uniref:uncharacterized protein LOC132544824 isoform X1 n=1 Tax=Ylistrum balloti TaxID=509963 RepID=UPI002905D8C4|nr:uncharacterized protein LOC132544824 isoform X1 [Ylistrum balloti]XP_060064464.1 uncharacterized protein LOC132544824 isoform X1 [Ylistrum balloti]